MTHKDILKTEIKADIYETSNTAERVKAPNKPEGITRLCVAFTVTLGGSTHGEYDEKIMDTPDNHSDCQHFEQPSTQPRLY